MEDIKKANAVLSQFVKWNIVLSVLKSLSGLAPFLNING